MRKPREFSRGSFRRTQLLLAFALITLTEFFDLAGADDGAHFAREKRVARAADFDLQILPCGIRLKAVATAVAEDRSGVVVRVNLSFHSRGIIHDRFWRV